MQPANYIAGFPTHPCASDSGSRRRSSRLCFVAYQDRVIQLPPDPPPGPPVFVSPELASPPAFHFSGIFLNGSFFMSRPILLANE